MLEISNVSKRFNLEAGFFAPVGRFVYAVNGVSFSVAPGEIFGLVGESGCGKTTTARLLVRMYEIDGGSVHFTDSAGREYNLAELGKKQLRELRSKVKYIFQDPARSLNPRMSIYDVLTAGYRYQPGWPGKVKAREEAAAILEDVGLSASDLERRPSDFSGGQRQRISIARALITRPELLICDEVVSALDVSVQGQILNLLLRLKDEYGFGIIFIAHDLAVVTYLCDRVAVMYRGMIMELASSKQLVSEATHPYTRHLYRSIPTLEPGERDRDSSEGSQPPSGSEELRSVRRFGEQPDPTVQPPGVGSALEEISPGHFVSPVFR